MCWCSKGVLVLIRWKQKCDEGRSAESLLFPPCHTSAHTGHMCPGHLFCLWFSHLDPFIRRSKLLTLLGDPSSTVGLTLSGLAKSRKWKIWLSKQKYRINIPLLGEWKATIHIKHSVWYWENSKLHLRWGEVRMLGGRWASYSLSRRSTHPAS